MIRTAFIVSIILVSTLSLAHADSTEGTILAFDRKANIIVLKDKTVWTLEGSEAAVPADLKAGDRVKIDYSAEGEDGISKIDSITVAAN